ncbi:MFS transporter [Anaerobacillus sp. CMMVII]|uniref:MFS transporter n=1 Tax=Anaerobacillus sp. CMMVII TaxID=2755588 RepID=UPI0021B7DF19|nr:MFS transporter [Anaerobacillus sp. CMMVII]MCT8137926.1 MFS transporter [Anaerobacillus sp. CMMVII]
MMNSTFNLKALLFFYFSAMTIIVGYLPVYFQENGLSGSQIGVLLAVGPLASMISQPFWGFMTDKYKSSKKIIFICLIGALIGSLFMFLSTTYVLLIVAVFFFFGFMSPVGGLGDSLTQKTANQLSVSFGSIRMWGSLGFAIMSLLSGFLLAKIGIQYIYLPFLFFTIISLILTLRVTDVTSSKKPINLKEATKLLGNKRFMIFLVIMMFITITHRTNDSFLGIYIVEKGGSESFIGWAWFIGVVSEALVFATATIWFRRFHALSFIVLSGVFFAFRWIVMGFIQEPLLVLPLQMMHGLSFGIFYLCAFHFVTKLIPEELQSTGHLLFYSFFFGLSGVIGSSIGGWIIDKVNVAYLYSALGVLSIIGVIFMVIYQVVYMKMEKVNSVSSV